MDGYGGIDNEESINWGIRGTAGYSDWNGGYNK